MSREFKLPSWSSHLPEDARLTAKEMSLILGYSKTVSAKEINKRLGIDGYNCHSSRGVASAFTPHKRVSWGVGDLRKLESK